MLPLDHEAQVRKSYYRDLVQEADRDRLLGAPQDTKHVRAWSLAVRDWACRLRLPMAGSACALEASS